MVIKDHFIYHYDYHIIWNINYEYENTYTKFLKENNINDYYTV